jgi:hypothetical protein
MTKPKPDITDPRTLAIESLKRLGGIEGFVSWAKSHRTLYYNLYAKLMAQPQVVNNVNVANIAVEDQSARRKLEDAFLRLIEARRESIGDPAVYVGGERLREPQYVDGRLIEHQPATADPTPDSKFENLKSPNQGPTFSPGGVATTPAETTLAGGKNKISNYPNPLSGGFAVALDGLDDNLSTTQRFLNWKGHGGPP